MDKHIVHTEEVRVSTRNVSIHGVNAITLLLLWRRGSRKLRCSRCVAFTWKQTGSAVPVKILIDLLDISSVAAGQIKLSHKKHS